MSTATKDNVNQDIVEYQTWGKFGNGKISITSLGIRQVEILWKGKPPLFAPSTQIDLESAKTKSMKEALDKACHHTGFLPTLRQEIINGPKALVHAYYRPNFTEGYATVTKQGNKALRFSLNRINLETMKCTSPREALKKVAFVTGSIKLISKPLQTH